MPKTKRSDGGGEDTTTAKDLRLMAASLHRMAFVHTQLAEWMEQNKVESIDKTNLKTAKRAIGYLWAFLASVLKAYGARADESGTEVKFSDEAMQTIFEAFIRSKQNDSRPGEKGS